MTGDKKGFIVLDVAKNERKEAIKMLNLLFDVKKNNDSLNRIVSRRYAVLSER